MIVLGYAAMTALGLLPLAALARMTGVADERTFLFPTFYAVFIGLAIGFAVCAVIGRILGVVGAQEIGTYSERYKSEVGSAAAARRRMRPAHSRIRSTAAAPFTRFS